MMTLCTTLPSCPFGTPRRPPPPPILPAPHYMPCSSGLHLRPDPAADMALSWAKRGGKDIRQQGLSRRVGQGTRGHAQSDGSKLGRVMSKQDGYAPLVPLVRVHGKRLCCLKTPTIPFAVCTCRLDLHLFQMTVSLASSYRRTSREAACVP